MHDTLCKRNIVICTKKESSLTFSSWSQLKNIEFELKSEKISMLSLKNDNETDYAEIDLGIRSHISTN